MNTLEILKLNEVELVAQLKKMDLAEMEGHARAIVSELGSDNYGGLMSKVMQCVKAPSPSQGETFKQVQTLVQETLPNEAYKSDIYARLSAIMMTIIARRFQAIYHAKD